MVTCCLKEDKSGQGKCKNKWTKAEKCGQKLTNAKKSTKKWKWGPPLPELALTMSNKTMQSGSWWRVAVSAEGDTVMELTTTVIASTWPPPPPPPWHWLLIRSGDMKARTNEGGQITIRKPAQTPRCSHKHNCMMLLCYCRSILMTTAGRRRGDVWLALMIGLRCDGVMHGVTRAGDGISLLVTSVTHCDNCHKSWHTHDKCVTDLLSVTQKVHRGNFQRCRRMRIFNKI